MKADALPANMSLGAVAIDAKSLSSQPSRPHGARITNKSVKPFAAMGQIGELEAQYLMIAAACCSDGAPDIFATARNAGHRTAILLHLPRAYSGIGRISTEQVLTREKNLL